MKGQRLLKSRQVRTIERIEEYPDLETEVNEVSFFRYFLSSYLLQN